MQQHWASSAHQASSSLTLCELGSSSQLVTHIVRARLIKQAQLIKQARHSVYRPQLGASSPVCSVSTAHASISDDMSGHTTSYIVQSTQTHCAHAKFQSLSETVLVGTSRSESHRHHHPLVSEHKAPCSDTLPNTFCGSGAVILFMASYLA